jgi:hypothetical protein
MAPTVIRSDISTIRGVDVTNEAATTIVPADSGIIFANKYAGAHTYTIPAVAAAKGKVFWFFNADAAGTIVITSPADDIMCTDDTYTTLTQSDSILGGWVCLISNGTNYYSLQDIGSTWTGS